jgi:hypothetical protein
MLLKTAVVAVKKNNGDKDFCLSYQLHSLTLGLAVYIGIVVGLVIALCEGRTIILLIDLLINFYAVAVVVVVVMSAC